MIFFLCERRDLVRLCGSLKNSTKKGPKIFNPYSSCAAVIRSCSIISLVCRGEKKKENSTQRKPLTLNPPFFVLLFYFKNGERRIRYFCIYIFSRDICCFLVVQKNPIWGVCVNRKPNAHFLGIFCVQSQVSYISFLFFFLRLSPHPYPTPLICSAKSK